MYIHFPGKGYFSSRVSFIDDWLNVDLYLPETYPNNNKNDRYLKYWDCFYYRILTADILYGAPICHLVYGGQQDAHLELNLTYCQLRNVAIILQV